MEQWKKNLIVLWFGQFLVMSGMTMIMPFLTLYLQTDLGLSDPHAIGIWAGAIFASNFVTAFYSSRYGVNCPNAMAVSLCYCVQASVWRLSCA